MEGLRQEPVEKNVELISVHPIRLRSSAFQHQLRPGRQGRVLGWYRGGCTYLTQMIHKTKGCRNCCDNLC